jgi:tetratricopeptide (TPR) repeat protein
MKIPGAVVALALAGLSASPALGQEQASNDEQCWDEAEEFAPEQQVAACTALIRSRAVPAEAMPQLYLARGWAYQEAGELDRALADFTETVRRAPRWAEGYGWRGGAYYQAADFDKALPDLARALELDPHNDNAGLWYFGRGHAYAVKGELEQAIVDFSQAISWWPDDAEPYAMRGTAFYDRGDYAPAIEDFARAASLAPEEPIHWNELCWTRAIADGDLDLALAECNQAIILEPAFAAALDSRGVVQLKRGQWQAAIADFDAALAVDPNVGSAFYGRGIALARLGDTAQAEANFATAVELEPSVAADFAGYGLTP